MPFESSAVLLDEPRPSTFGDPSTKVDLPGLTLNASTGRNCFRPRAYSKRGRRPIPTVILHHSALLRAGLAHILAETQFRIRAQCSSFEHLPQRALAGEQCLALVGIDQTDTDAVPSEILDLKSRYPHVHVIALGEELRARALLSLIEAGADGYLLTCEVTPEALLRCFEVVVLGGVVIPRGSIRIQEEKTAFRPDASDLIESPPSSASVPTSMHDPAQSAEFGRLSNREQAILREIMQGASNKHIARSLDIAEATVKVHVKNLLRKLRVTNRTQAAMSATAHFPESAGTEVSTRLEISPEDRGTTVDRRSGDANDDRLPTGQGPSANHNGESLATGASPGFSVNGGENRQDLKPAMATSPLKLVSPLVTEVVRYLRQQDDVVVPEGNGIFLVNGRFRLETSELVDKANRMRTRQNQPLFHC